MTEQIESTESKRLVRNNGVAILDFPRLGRKEGISLRPGINGLTQEKIDWIEGQENKDSFGKKQEPGNKLWRFYKRKGTISVLELETEDGNKTSELSFDDMHRLNAEDAIKLVEGTHDMETLKGWQIKETRKGVGAVIATKIETLTPPKRNATK